MVGQTVAFDEGSRVIEEVTGKKLKVGKVGSNELKRRADSIDGFGKTRDEILTKMISQIDLLVIEEQEGMYLLRPVVNELCPEIKPMSVREMVEDAWSWAGIDLSKVVHHPGAAR